jgi:hypothetical protein
MVSWTLRKRVRRCHQPASDWVNTTVINVKSVIVGACRAIRQKHLARYLVAFESLRSPMRSGGHD